MSSFRVDKREDGDAATKSCSDAELQQQLCKLAGTILKFTRTVEAALMNMRTVAAMIARISDKMNSERLLSDEERSLLELTEAWLNSELNRTNGLIQCAKFTELPNFQLAMKTESTPTADPLTKECRSKSIHSSVTSMQTSDVAEGDCDELDWDSNGVELSESFHSNSATCANTSSFLEPFSSSFVINSSSSDTTVSKPPASVTPPLMVAESCSYEGIYEEEMEMTLEFEEGFYSDSSSCGTPNNKFCLDFSPQADSGVTHLGSNPSTDQSMSQNEVELSLEHSASSYNKGINTWDIFATVILDDDLQSTASESNTSTPQVTRKKCVSLAIPEISSKYAPTSTPSTCSPRIPEPLNERVAATPTPPCTCISSIPSVCILPTPPSTISCAVDNQEPHTSFEVRNAKAAHMASLPNLNTGKDDTNVTLQHVHNHIAQSLNNIMVGNSEMTSLNDSDYLRFKSAEMVVEVAKTERPSSSYCDTEVPASLHQNNYHKRSRRAILV